MRYNTNYDPAFPEAKIRISFTHRGQTINIHPFDALVDTGADRTCIPASLIPAEPNLYFRRLPVAFGDGRKAMGKFLVLFNAEVEFLDPLGNKIAGRQHQQLELYIINEALLGRDILNSHISQFDGPNGTCGIN